MSLKNQPFTNLMNIAEPMIQMIDPNKEYHLHSNNTDDSINLVNMSADCVGQNTSTYAIDIFVEEATQYVSDPLNDIFLESDLPYASGNTDLNNHIKLIQKQDGGPDIPITSIHSYRSKLHDNATQLILENLSNSETSTDPETVLITDQFSAPQGKYYRFAAPANLTQPKLGMDLETVNPVGQYNILRISDFRMYAYWHGSESDKPK